MTNSKNLEYFALTKGGFVDGPFGSNLPASDYTENGVPVIRGTNLSKGEYKFKNSNFKYVSQKTANRLSKCKCIPNDIIFTKKGTIGQVGIVPNSQFEEYIISSNQMRLRLNSSLADPQFVYYYLSSPRVIKQIIMEAMTTGVPKINLGYIRKFRVKFPPLPTQKKIAAILSAYDDLIENNNQRIRLLEEMAEEIYKEWFVRLRFPGYQEATFRDKDGKVVPHGTVGALPEGWEEILFKNFIKLNRGFDLPEDKIIEGEFPVVASTKIKAFHNQFKVDAPCVVTGRSGSLGVVQYINSKCWPLNTSLYVKDFKGNSTILVYYHLKFMRLENFNSGAGVPTLNQNHLHGYKVQLPPKGVQEAFDTIVKPMNAEVDILVQKNQVLRETRDLLLPRLISGKLRVDDLEIDTL